MTFYYHTYRNFSFNMINRSHVQLLFQAGSTNPDVTLNLIDLTDHGSSLISLKTPVDIVGS
jgi:hypothetical protein